MIKVEYVDHMGDDLRIVNAARISYSKQSEALNEKDEKLIDFLAKNEHMGVFEHNILSVIIHCPLYIRSQIHRHRTFSYNEVSRRYTSENLEFYYPDKLRVQDTKNKQGSELEVDELTNSLSLQKMKQLQKDAVRLYEDMIFNGIAKELARSILPQNLMTKFYMTGNLRNWAHFVRLRIAPHAQKEVQLIGNEVKDIIEDKFPVAFKALNKHTLGVTT